MMEKVLDIPGAAAHRSPIANPCPSFSLAARMAEMFVEVRNSLILYEDFTSIRGAYRKAAVSVAKIVATGAARCGGQGIQLQAASA